MKYSKMCLHTSEKYILYLRTGRSENLVFVSLTKNTKELKAGNL